MTYNVSSGTLSLYTTTLLLVTLFIIIVIIINKEIIVAFSPRTTRTRYKVKNKTARYVVSSSIEKLLVTDTTAQTIVS